MIVAGRGNGFVALSVLDDGAGLSEDVKAPPYIRGELHLSNERRSGPAGKRAALMQSLPAGGGMTSILAPEAEVLALIEGKYYELRSPRIQALDPRGAGDSLTAGLAVGFARELDWLEMLRLGVAAGALNVTRHGLGTGNRDDIEQLRERVEIIPYDG